ncbi:uncharacterized protein LOC106646041 [Copidosoma floridanum]|uniref:uncharacterized protein LOC106646041 n=1 Tax=Copidosoma floridanum TaxID=29053 RepID=UPI0006C9DE5E|nr:uncharacterized protein LOC106646041 [Copidosoma floridanum]
MSTTPATSTSLCRIKVVESLQKKPTLSEEFKRNLSVIAKSIASKMLVASNPNVSPEKRTISLNDLLTQINVTPSPVDRKDKIKLLEQQVDEKSQGSEEKFQKIVIGYLVNISENVKELKSEVSKLSQQIKNTKPTTPDTRMNTRKLSTFKQLGDKHSYKLPLTSVEDFERFDKNLAETGSSLRTDLTTILTSFYDKNLSISKYIEKVMKAVLSKEVAVQFTAVKQAKGKKIMKSTQLFSCIEAVVKDQRRQSNLVTTDKELAYSLSCVMTSTAQWNKPTLRREHGSARYSDGHPNEHDESSQSEMVGKNPDIIDLDDYPCSDDTN